MYQNNFQQQNETKQITDKDLLYSTRNSIPCSVMTYMGKEYKKGYIIYM